MTNAEWPKSLNHSDFILVLDSFFYASMSLIGFAPFTPFKPWNLRLNASCLMPDEHGIVPSQSSMKLKLMMPGRTPGQA